MKWLQANLFLADFSYLEPTCGALWRHAACKGFRARPPVWRRWRAHGALLPYAAILRAKLLNSCLPQSNAPYVHCVTDYYAQILKIWPILDTHEVHSFDWFSFLKKKFTTADSKKPTFSKSPILKKFLWKFYGLVLGLVGLIDAKGIDVAQPIWSWDCPT